MSGTLLSTRPQVLPITQGSDLAPRGGLTAPSDNYDLANMQDALFEKGLAAMRTRQKRAERIMKEGLAEDVHFGNPKDKRGNAVFKKPILYKAGAEEIRIAFRLRLVSLHETPDVVVEGPEYVSVTVHRGIVDLGGNIVAIRSASCNSLERRFEKFSGQGMIYKDPREVVHICLAIAEKRCGNALTCEALGLSGYFATDDHASGGDTDDVIQAWTPEEKGLVYTKASAKGMGRKTLLALVEQTLGRTTVGTGADVKQLLEAIEKWEKPTAPTDANPASAHEALEEENNDE